MDAIREYLNGAPLPQNLPLDLRATALILVHNHPSGDPTPSREDIAMTREVKASAAALEIVLHDHVIIGNGSWISFRREGLL